MTGAWLAASAARIVSGETWLKSTSMPRRFISFTTSTPNGVRPWCAGASVAESAHGGVGGVGQRHVARAGVVHLAQHRQGIVDLMAAFDADQRSNLVRLVNAANIRGRIGHLEIGRILRRHALDQIDLLQRHLHRLEALQSHRYPHRPELRAHMPGAQSRNIRHQRRLARADGQVAVSDRRSTAARSLLKRSRISHGKSLWPSISGVCSSTCSTRC